MTSQPHYKTHVHQFLGICQPVVRPVNLQSELLTVFKIIIIIIIIIIITIITITTIIIIIGYYKNNNDSGTNNSYCDNDTIKVLINQKFTCCLFSSRL